MRCLKKHCLKGIAKAPKQKEVRQNFELSFGLIFDVLYINLNFCPAESGCIPFRKTISDQAGFC